MVRNPCGSGRGLDEERAGVAAEAERVVIEDQPRKSRFRELIGAAKSQDINLVRNSTCIVTS